MNRGHVLQQQMIMAGGSPNWWNINNNMRPPPPPSQPPPPPPSSSSFLPSSPILFSHYPPPPPVAAVEPTSSAASLLPSSSWNDDNQELPESWGQLLLGGLVGEEENKCGMSENMEAKKLEMMINWEEQLLQHQKSVVGGGDMKQESSSLSNLMYNHGDLDMEFEGKAKAAAWSQMMMPAVSSLSSPNSCVTSLSSSGNMLDFSTKSDHQPRHPPPDHSSECNSTATGGAAKKARVNPSSTQSTFKVRKEKLGDRITALHQIVSPFGKTDTASVLLEAIGYIRFLHSQIEALSIPYLGNGSGNMRPPPPQQPVQGEKNCLFPEDSSQESHEEAPQAKKDLRSRGLCVVPISCTLQVGSDNGADYWAPSFNNNGGFQ